MSYEYWTDGDGVQHATFHPPAEHAGVCGSHDRYVEPGTGYLTNVHPACLTPYDARYEPGTGREVSGFDYGMLADYGVSCHAEWEALSPARQAYIVNAQVNDALAMAAGRDGADLEMMAFYGSSRAQQELERQRRMKAPEGRGLLGRLVWAFTGA
jgi:hypothetical protein